MSANPFQRFPEEAKIVTGILTGYANLELSLVHCIAQPLGDFDAAFRTVFSIRGETPRINAGQQFGDPHFQKNGLNSAFSTGIDAMRHCLLIRNQYSHWIWWDDKSGKMALANIENLAKIPPKIKNLGSLTNVYTDLNLLREQEAYFAYADNCLAWVNFETRKLLQKLANDKNPLGSNLPTPLRKPDLHLP